MSIDWNLTTAAIWRPRHATLRPVRRSDPIRLADLVGIEPQKRQLTVNTERFLAGLPANNALLWGARGTGKSSLVKGLLNEYQDRGLRIIQIDRDDLVDLPEIVDAVGERPQRFIVFCDDLSFEPGDTGYRALKTVLEGSLELPPENILMYATSNRRHLVPEQMSDNQETRLIEGELHHGDAVEEKISLSDRFGLWLSFYPINLSEYLAIVDNLFPDHPDRERLHQTARQFAMVRGSRSGRTARQFYNAYQEIS